MLQTFFIFASEAAEAEPSKTPFYVAGSVLAIWAVAVFALGMRSETFPGSGWIYRGIIGVSAALVAVTLFTSIITG